MPGPGGGRNGGGFGGGGPRGGGPRPGGFGRGPRPHGPGGFDPRPGGWGPPPPSPPHGFWGYRRRPYYGGCGCMGCALPVIVGVLLSVLAVCMIAFFL